MGPHQIRPTAATIAVGVALTLAACGGGDSPGDATTSEETTDVGTGTAPDPTDGGIGPDHSGDLPDGVEHATTTSDLNLISVGAAATEGEVAAECLGNELGLVVSLAGTSSDHGELTAVLSFENQELTSVVVQSTGSPDDGGPLMWMTSSGPGEELTVVAAQEDDVWTVIGTVGGFETLTQVPVEAVDLRLVADCSG